MEASSSISETFQSHAAVLRQKARERQEQVRPKSHLTTLVPYTARPQSPSEDDQPLTVQSNQERTFIGDKRLANVQRLLALIDDRGYERSSNQCKFHDAFIRASGRCIYKEEWEVHRRAIMAKNNWKSDCSEVLVSTPRRFGKTFSIAMFCASMALSFSTTIVVFSPSSRGSRSLLERMNDFVRLLGAEKRIISYNQENLRVRSLDGGVSLLRSFPSKVEVRATACVCDCPRSSPPNTHHSTQHTHNTHHTHHPTPYTFIHICTQRHT